VCFASSLSNHPSSRENQSGTVNSEKGDGDSPLATRYSPSAAPLGAPDNTERAPRVLFMGTGEIGRPTLDWIAHTNLVKLVGVVTQPDRPVGRHQTLTPPFAKKVALDLGIPALQPERVRRPESLAAVRQLEPDLIIVMAYGQILPKALLEIPTLACLNLHASLLPRYRGAGPIQAVILNGDTVTGMTLMYVDEGLDTGDVLLARPLTIRRRETGGSLHDRLAIQAAHVLSEALPMLLRGDKPRFPQNEAEASYAPKLNRDSGLMDWSQDSAVLDRLVRGLNPWPGAYTHVTEGSSTRLRLKIHRALPMRRLQAAPGSVIAISGRGIQVGCGSGALLLLEVQLEGKRRLSAADFAHGFRLKLGTNLG
jgi:methionyl-tRNA formyltransferase